MDITTKDKDPAEYDKSRLFDKDNLTYDDIYAYGL